MSVALIHYQDGFENRPGRLESATFAFVAACFSLGVRRCDDDYSHRAHTVRRTSEPPAWSQNSRQRQADAASKSDEDVGCQVSCVIPVFSR